MVEPRRGARVVSFSGVTSVIEGRFIIEGIHCTGGGTLVNGNGVVIASFPDQGQGFIPFYKKFMVDGMQKTTGDFSDMYVYLDASEEGGHNGGK